MMTNQISDSKVWTSYIAGFVSIVTYYSGWILEKINTPTELKTIVLDTKES